jgi:hypothetical protein
MPDLCVTTQYYGNRHNEDVRIAPQLARAAGANWKLIKPRRNQLWAELDKNRLTGFCADEHGWALGIRDFLAEHPFRTSFDGLGGDMLSVCQFQSKTQVSLFRAGRLDEIIDELLRVWSPGESWLQAVLRPELYRQVPLDRARARIKCELKPFVERPNPVAAFYFWNRIRREIALYSFRIIPPGVLVLCPYLDADLFDFLSALPAEITVDKTFHDETIATAYPEFARLPYEDKAARPKGRGLYWRCIAAALAAGGFGSLRSQFVNEVSILLRLAKAALTGYEQLLQRNGPALLTYLRQLGVVATG